MSGNAPPNNSEFQPQEILGRIDRLYSKLAPVPITPPETWLSSFGAPTLEMPTLESLSDRVAQCSFKVFDDATAYHQNPRAKEYVSWSMPRTDAYRIYFNVYSKKIYVDLNGKRWVEVRSKLEEEKLFCDILRTLIWVLVCEVELFELREAEKRNADAAVTANVIEVVIPSSSE